MEVALVQLMKWVVLSFLMLCLTSSGSDVLSFNGLSDEEMIISQQIYITTQEHFYRLTGKQGGKLPIEISMVDNLRNKNEVGLMIFCGNRIVIKINKNCKSSFGRVLTHEFVHAFSRESYGETTNKSLSEGLAEYITSKFYSAEVSRDIRLAEKNVVKNSRLMPYVMGYNFCLHNAEHIKFKTFLETQIKNLDFGYDHLSSSWERYIL